MQGMFKHFDQHSLVCPNQYESKNDSFYNHWGKCSRNPCFSTELVSQDHIPTKQSLSSYLSSFLQQGLFISLIPSQGASRINHPNGSHPQAEIINPQLCIFNTRS